MSNDLIVPAVTYTLRDRVLDALSNGGFPTEGSADVVTLLAPDRARDKRTSLQTNIFLYQATLNPAWRNQDMPGRGRPGEAYNPPLPLDLHYLFTFYANESGGYDEEIEAQRMMAIVRREVLDRATLATDEIRRVLNDLDPLQSGELDARQEALHVSETLLSLDEVSRLWAGFQVKYRLSATFVVSVALVESRRKKPAAAPVISRGRDDRGFPADAHLGLPELEELLPPPLPFGRGTSRRLPGLRPGDAATVRGRNLNAIAPRVAVAHATLTEFASVLPIVDRTESSFGIELPDDEAALARWPAGFYTLAAELLVELEPLGLPGTPPPRTNRLAFPLLPRIVPITDTGLPVAANNTLTIPVVPPVQPGQDVALLVGSQSIALPTPLTAAASSLTFRLDPAVWTGPDQEIITTLPVRLRVDGVDSLLFNPVSPRAEYDPRMRLRPPGT